MAVSGLSPGAPVPSAGPESSVTTEATLTMAEPQQHRRGKHRGSRIPRPSLLSDPSPPYQKVGHTPQVSSFCLGWSTPFAEVGLCIAYCKLPSVSLCVCMLRPEISTSLQMLGLTQSLNTGWRRLGFKIIFLPPPLSPESF